jgi:ribonuclease P protein component
MRFITSKREYQSVYEDNIKYEGNLFIVLKKKIPDDLFTVGIVVNKKVGKAVNRNKVKRRVKAFLRENAHLYKNGKKIVVIAKPEAGNAEWKEIEKELTVLFSR